MPIPGVLSRAGFPAGLTSRAVPIEPTPIRVPTGHVPALDGLRGLAILLVLVTHGVDASLQPTGPVELVVYNLARWGWIGVDLFFVLSGFLITGILLGSREKPRYLTNFYARRALRIFPLYCATILVCLVLLPMAPWPRFDWLRDLGREQRWFWLHLSNYYTICINDPPVHWMSTLWSLAVEEHFYLVWPFLVWRLAPRRILQACGVLLAVSLGLRYLFAGLDFPPQYIYRGTATRLDGLVMGAALAVIVRGGKGLDHLVTEAKALLLVGIAAVLMQMLRRNGGHGRDTTFYGMTLQYTVIGLLFCSVLALVLTAPAGSWLGRLFTWPPLLTLGKYSYAIYILNKPTYLFLKGIFLPSEWPLFGSAFPAVAAFVLVGSVLTFLGAQLTWRLLEKPALDLKRYFEYR